MRKGCLSDDDVIDRVHGDDGCDQITGGVVSEGNIPNIDASANAWVTIKAAAEATGEPELCGVCPRLTPDEL